MEMEFRFLRTADICTKKNRQNGDPIHFNDSLLTLRTL
jgi:hypothetical protein